jgi:hypothetical protein
MRCLPVPDAEDVVFLSSGLKGQCSVAQGNALGNGRGIIFALKGQRSSKTAPPFQG